MQQRSQEAQPIQKNKFASLSHGSDGSQVGVGSNAIAGFQNSRGDESKQNTMQMFYGDYYCDDEPEEDDHSN